MDELNEIVIMSFRTCHHNCFCRTSCFEFKACLVYTFYNKSMIAHVVTATRERGSLKVTRGKRMRTTRQSPVLTP